MVMHSVVMEGLTEEVTFEQTLGSWGSRKKTGRKNPAGRREEGPGCGSVLGIVRSLRGLSVARAETKKAE